MKFLSKEKIHTLFRAGLVVKTIDSITEIALGISFFALSSQTVNKIVAFIFGDELTEQPRDVIWNFLLHGFNGITTAAQSFWAIIFLAHGLVKIALVIGLAKKKLWVYPAAAVAFTCLVIYQTYEIARAPSLFLCLLTAIDTIFAFLIAQEYQYQKRIRS